MHKPRAGDHYRGAAATATQSDHGLNDERVAFDLEVKTVSPDGGFDALLTFTEARFLEDGSPRTAEALVGRTVSARFEPSGRLQRVMLDGLDEELMSLVNRALGAWQATGPVSPLDMRTMKTERPRQASLSAGEGIPVITTFRAETLERTARGPFNVIAIGGEQQAEVLAETQKNVKAQVRVSGRARASMRDLFLGETRVGTAVEYVDESSEAKASAAEAKPLVARRSDAIVRLAPVSEPEPKPGIDGMGDGEGLFACSDRVSALTTRIQAMAPMYSAADTSVPLIAGELVQYGQDSGPRVVLGPEGTYVIDVNGTRGAALDRNQIGQALAQALPQSEQVVVYIDADQSVQAKLLLDVATTLREMTQALEVQLEGRLLVGARTIKLPDMVSYPRLRDEAGDLEGAKPSLRLGLVPQILREELGRTCYAGYRASAESFAAGVSLSTARRAVPGLVAACGCQGIDLQFLDGWLGLFDARVLGAGWIPLPQTSGSGKAIRLNRKATVGDLLAQVEQLGVSPSEIAQLKVLLK